MINANNTVSLRGYLPLSEKFNIFYSAGKNGKCSLYRATLRVRRAFKKDGVSTYDLISFKAFGSTADYLGQYAQHGTSLSLVGTLEKEDDYEDKNGNRRFGQLVVSVDQAIINYEQGQDNDKAGKAVNNAAPNPLMSNVQPAAEMSQNPWNN